MVYEAGAQDVMKLANAGMYQAKESGRNVVRVYQPGWIHDDS